MEEKKEKESDHLHKPHIFENSTETNKSCVTSHLRLDGISEGEFLISI